MKKDKILYKGKYVTLVDRKGYEFIKDMTGVAVAVLPFRSGDKEIEFLARLEPVPCHSPSLHLCSLTGGVEKGEKPEAAAYRELFEEAGYKADSGIISLGMVYSSKASSTKVHLFAIDVTEMTQQEAPGDGTDLEAKSSVEWLQNIQATMVPDAFFGSMMLRLSFWFMSNLAPEK